MSRQRLWMLVKNGRIPSEELGGRILAVLTEDVKKLSKELGRKI